MLNFRSTGGLYLDEDLGNLVLVFTSDDLQHNFSIQDSLEYTEDQIKSGINTYYIQRDDQGYSTYGGIESIQLAKNQLFVKFDKTGSENLATDCVQIDFSLTNSEFEKLEKMLRKIFERRKVLGIVS